MKKELASAKEERESLLQCVHRIFSFCNQKRNDISKKTRTFEETKKTLFEYIEGWYNSRRIQKKLDYQSP